MGTLASDRQPFPVAKPTVAADIHQALDVGHHFTAKIAFHLVVLFKLFTDLVNLFRRKVVNAATPINACAVENFQRRCTADTIYIGKSDVRALALGQIYSRDSCHVKLLCCLALALLVPGVFTYNPQNAITTNHLALGADSFN
jgi:hypothetical protein